MKIYFILLVILAAIFLFTPIVAADNLLSYGFEDWGGNVENTGGYPFGSNYLGYCEEHQAASEVVTSYGSLEPFSGNYFWLLNHSEYALNVSVPGITSGAVNAHDNIGLGSDVFCTNNPLNLPANPSELYISFRFAGSGWENITDTNSKLKLIRYYDADATEPILYVLKESKTGSPMWAIFGPSGYHYGPIQSNLFDGNWHKISFYANYDSGDMYLWVDIANESFSNYTFHASDSLHSSLDSLVLISNWSAYNPTGPIWHALDDIGIWDSMPNVNQGSTDPTDSIPSILITSPTQETTFEVNDASINLQGTANDDFGLISVSWTSSAGYQGEISNSFNNWTTGLIPLQEGQNQITVTATDNNNQSSSDTLTVTYLPGDNNLTWSATEQAGDTTWSDSKYTWCVRALVEGSSITTEGGQVLLGFQGRNSGSYSIRKVSIAERDPNGSEGDVVNSTWTQVTFDGNDLSTWDTDSTTVSAGTEKLSDAMPFAIEPNKDYYVTFVMEAPSAYLVAPSYYDELYFDGADHASDVDWSSTGFSSYASRLHALSSIYVLEDDGSGSIIALPGIPGGASIVID